MDGAGRNRRAAHRAGVHGEGGAARQRRLERHAKGQSFRMPRHQASGLSGQERVRASGPVRRFRGSIDLKNAVERVRRTVSVV